MGQAESVTIISARLIVAFVTIEGMRKNESQPEPVSHIGRAIKRFADQRKLSIAKWTRESGVTRTVVANLFRSPKPNSSLMVEAAYALAKSQNVTIEELCGFDPIDVAKGGAVVNLSDIPVTELTELQATQLMIQLLRQIAQSQEKQTETLQRINDALAGRSELPISAEKKKSQK